MRILLVAYRLSGKDLLELNEGIWQGNWVTAARQALEEDGNEINVLCDMALRSHLG